MNLRQLKIGFLFVALAVLCPNGLKAFTAVTSGNWSNIATWGGVAPGSIVSGQDIIIPAGMVVYLDTDVTFSGLLNVFNVNGTLSSATINELTISQGTLTGNGLIDIERIEFGSLSSATYTGNLTLDELHNSGSVLSLAAVVNISDSLDLDAGPIALSIGSNLEIGTGATIRRDAGTLVMSGGVFNSGNNYNVLYTGASKTSGIELNSVSIENVYLQMADNLQTISLSNDLIVNNTLTMSAGHLDISGYDLSIYENMIVSAGTMFQSNSASNILLQSGSVITSGFTFEPASSVNMLTIDHSGSGNVKLNSPLIILGAVRLLDGSLSLENTSVLEMGSGSIILVEDGALTTNGGNFDGTQSYNLAYVGGTLTTGIEFTGAGLNDVEIDLNNNTEEINFGSSGQIDGHLNLLVGVFDLAGFDLTLNGTIDQQPTSLIKGNVVSDLILNLNASGNEIIRFHPSNQTLKKMTANILGSGIIILGSDLIIKTELTMAQGKIDIDGYDLIIEAGGTIVGYSDTKYIIARGSGHLQMYVAAGSTYTVFPVGTSANYSPASIQQTVGSSSGNFMVNLFNGVYTGGTVGTNVALTKSVVNRTWNIESQTGLIIDMNLKLGWLVAAEVNGFDRTNAYISHYSTNWDTYTASPAMVGLNNTYELERTGIMSLSPFAVTDENSSLKVNEENGLLMINIYPNPCAEIISVNYENNSGQFVYQVSDISGKTFDLVNDGSNQFDVSFLCSGVYLLRIIDLNTNVVVIKEFIKK